MKHLIFTLIAFIWLSHNIFAQLSTRLAYYYQSESDDAIAMITELPNDQDDPAMKLYKQGYNLILDEQWEDARKVFSKIISKYPKSNYIDDAEYWSAYALKHINKKTAAEAYEKFIKAHPRSTYYDDAVADLSELNKSRSKVIEKLTVKGDARVYVTEDGLFMSEGTQKMQIDEDGVIIGEGPESLVIDKHGITISGDGKSFSYSYGFAPRAKSLERAIKLYSGKISRIRSRTISPRSVSAVRFGENKNIDSVTRLKLEALYSLSESKEAERTYQTLKEVALNYKQPRPIREAALEVLSEFKKFDIIPIYIDIVKNDTSEDLQIYAIDYIAQYSKDKNKTTTVLINLFKSLPRTHTEQRQM
ncbi:MAG: outer membrane protein assembly factor BamD, partial [Ignavibacteriales bacterium]|nr:outer membrane protein assembly factor BamD [Ignavibacteriales bacterium]